MLARILGRTPPTSDSAVPNRPLSTIDLERYMGLWHEIAHLPSIFQRQCEDNVTANYELKENGRVRVHNQCRTRSGEVTGVVGEARAAGGPQGALKVRFAPKFLSFIPMVWADYWILEVCDDYKWALVGGPDRSNLWILSRTPKMDEHTFQDLRDRAKQRGYDVSKLIVMAPLISDAVASEN